MTKSIIDGSFTHVQTLNERQLAIQNALRALAVSVDFFVDQSGREAHVVCTEYPEQLAEVFADAQKRFADFDYLLIAHDDLLDDEDSPYEPDDRLLALSTCIDRIDDTVGKRHIYLVASDCPDACAAVFADTLPQGEHCVLLFYPANNLVQQPCDMRVTAVGGRMDFAYTSSYTRLLKPLVEPSATYRLDAFYEFREMSGDQRAAIAREMLAQALS